MDEQSSNPGTNGISLSTTKSRLAFKHTYLGLMGNGCTVSFFVSSMLHSYWLPSGRNASPLTLGRSGRCFLQTVCHEYTVANPREFRT
jgi:hypothetical protein